MLRAAPVLAAVLILIALAALSLLAGASSMSIAALFGVGDDGTANLILMASRIPRTFAVMLAGCGLAVAGAVMQMIALNRFAEPSTTGTVESAQLGMILVLLAAPESPVFVKMLVAAAFAMGGTALFFALIRRMPMHSAFLIPLVGLTLGGIVSSVTVFIAYRQDLMQSLSAWTTGDFSSAMRGRYELLWISLAVTVFAYVVAVSFTLAGLGEDIARSTGLDYRRTLFLGMGVVSLVTAAVTVTVGAIPFIGLIVPNLVALVLGDNLRKTLPWVALAGSAFALVCDMLGRVVIKPYEIPAATITGVIGGAFFLFMLMRRRHHAG
ncbi:iron chelate uptake ABC transporter family permease subunit [Rhizobium sp. FKL33]|uniref:ABC transporter permease n=1 Tax=Rhizobium sp. FKL33 TaxID=2562307 RepID=UPI0010C016A1|nr:iron chelate uptake ABC transporter family permease subunit [Rhizobium sp. FKL33]